MADNSTDKQIQELLQIRLGLEQRADKIFDRLLNRNEEDPLDDIFKSFINKNREIERLKNQLTTAQLQLKRLRQQNLRSSSGYFMPQRQQRHKSLPERHEQLMKNVQQNKKAVIDFKHQLKARTESFIIFLLKCIRQLSRDARPEDTEKLVEGFQKSLKKQQQRIMDPQAFSQKNRSSSERSTSYNQSSQRNLQTLVQNIENTKEPQALFEKISISLGLENLWRGFFNKLKQQSDLFYFLKDKILKPAPGLFGSQEPKFEEKITENAFQWNITVDRVKKEALKKHQQKQQIANIVNQMVEQKMRQIGKPGERAYELVKTTVQYFYERLDQMFAKHNQHPFELVKRANLNIVKDKVKNFMVNADYESAQEVLRCEIDQAFHFMERKTKFYSANRVILRSR